MHIKIKHSTKCIIISDGELMFGFAKCLVNHAKLSAGDKFKHHVFPRIGKMSVIEHV